MAQLFTKYITEVYPEFIFDEKNHKLITMMSQWAERDSKFNKNEVTIGSQTTLSLDKGFLILGSTGSGKTTLMELFKRFLYDWGSDLAFESDIVWEMAERFSHGDTPHSEKNSKHMFYDELCLLDDDGSIHAEIATYYGNKVFMGDRLIRERYTLLEKGKFTHFTTNATLPELKQAYHDRNISRLYEMCNIIPYVAVDRRGAGATNIFKKNVNRRKLLEGNASEKKAEEPLGYDDEMKARLNKLYERFLNGEKPQVTSFEWHRIREYDSSYTMTEYQIQENLIPMVRDDRKREVMDFKFAKDDREGKRMRELQEQYKAGKLDTDESALLLKRAYSLAVYMYFQQKVKAGATKLFFLCSDAINL